MRVEIVIRYIGLILIFNAFFLFISFLVSLYLSEATAIPFLYSTAVALLFGLLPLIYVPRTPYLTILEGINIVVFGWITTCLVGSLPYILWGGEFTLINSWFESVSGYTTTGSTILKDIEVLPYSLLLWRSSTHWIGGVGIILFILLILPQSNAGRLTLLNTEMSSLAKTAFQSRAREILRILIYVYFGLTVLETLLLMASGLSLFDAVNHAFATIATGGFSTKNLSVASFDNLPAEIVIMVFMVLAGIHFGLLYNTIFGRKKNIFRSPVVRAYLVFLLLGIIFVAAKLYCSGTYPFWEALRYASFQVISLGTTTGFANADTAYWPGFTQLILIYFTIQCATSGSTSGGMKFDRVWIFFKAITKQIKMIQHPRGVFTLRVGDELIDKHVENQVMVFIILYLFIIFITTLLLSMLNIDLMTAFSSSVATIGNVGPGFGHVSSLGNFSALPALGKFLLTINMLLGRLEIFGIISLFFIKSWK